MKVLQIMAGNEEGGLENHFIDMVNTLSKVYDVSVIAHQKYQNRVDDRVVFYPLDLSKGRKNIFILYRLIKYILYINPDILHVHASKGADMIARISYWIPKHIKTVVTIHSKKRKLKSYMKFDYIIGVSRSVIDMIPHKHKRVIYNGVDLPKIQHDFTKDKSKFTICAIGRLVKVKNFSLLLNAIKELDVRLILIGEGEKEAALRQEIKMLGIEEKVVMSGYREDALEFLAQSDLLVITSHKEGFSYVMAEALLLRKPVISTEVADMKKLLPEGYVLKEAQSTLLRDKIHYVSENYTEVMKVFERSFAFAKENFTRTKMYEKVKSLYGEMLEESLSIK